MRQDAIFSQLNAYSELVSGWDGIGSVPPLPNAIRLARDFVAIIPANFPQPRAMLSREGTVGLYWNTASMYVDIQFESECTFSLFSRTRISGKERFIDLVNVATINSSWFYDNLGELL